jgi:hypothetical protein
MKLYSTRTANNGGRRIKATEIIAFAAAVASIISLVYTIRRDKEKRERRALFDRTKEYLIKNAK